MWWGGFSELTDMRGNKKIWVLIPMWWGGFSEVWEHAPEGTLGLNPHVVGRFFRVNGDTGWVEITKVLIPMWWGGFSETEWVRSLLLIEVLIPMWWGGFSEWRFVWWCMCCGCLNPHVVGRFFRERRGVFSIKFSSLKWPISKLQIFTKINGD